MRHGFKILKDPPMIFLLLAMSIVGLGMAYELSIGTTDLKAENKVNDCGITIRHSIVFKGDLAVKINQKTMGTGELFLWSGDAKSRDGKILKNALLSFDDKDDLLVGDATKKKPFIGITVPMREFKVKNLNNKIFIKRNDGEWERLLIKFIREIPEGEHEEETYPCMLLEIKCKWFEGKYVLWDYPE